MSLSMNLYLPIAGASVNCLAIFGLGGVVGLLSGIFGVGGGFLMTPLLIMLGIPPTVAAASDSNQIVGASTSGTLAHFRHGNVDIKMGLLLLIGGIVGGTLGVQIIALLRKMGNADFLISITYVLMLGFVGGYMFLESLQAMRKPSQDTSTETTKGESLYARLVRLLPLQIDFQRSGIQLSVLMPFILGVLVGVLAAIMGVGGGFILVPTLLAMSDLPMKAVVATSMGVVALVSVVGVVNAGLAGVMPWAVAWPFAAGALTGLLGGRWFASHLAGPRLQQGFAMLSLGIAATLLVRAAG